MSRTLSSKTVALQDQMLAILRDTDGFPLSTGDIAKQMGTKTVERRGWCRSCGHAHVCRLAQDPICAEDIRPVLVRMDRDGVIEKIVVEGHRKHYWRSS